MPRPRRPELSSRKHPQQDRSTELVAAILEAAIQVLAREGAHRFTTIRVAEKAGVSVGSLYQYFPNKAAILFRLQSDEWRQTTALLRGILEDRGRPVEDRLRRVVLAFVQSECAEARTRVALGDAAPLYRDAPEARQARAAGRATFQAFIEEALPHQSGRVRAVAGHLIKTTLTAGGKSFSATPRTPAEIEAFARAMADMFSAYLERLRSA